MLVQPDLPVFMQVNGVHDHFWHFIIKHPIVLPYLDRGDPVNTDRCFLHQSLGFSQMIEDTENALLRVLDLSYHVMPVHVLSLKNHPETST
ncbi:hypothetical protein COCCU_06600 [Corynebacterium occultum]|uniref:Uncharacterized protein n=1 Tax=Corynebacterium occultum TaxID=2675219 RepID=A0A6B8WLG8_9CORY|nr:hypothetical protein COCCU_06600 [Corynebacterium occultum]